MTTPRAIFAGMVLIAVAVGLSHANDSASQTGSVDFQGITPVLSGSSPGLWRLNAATGEVSYCEGRREQSTKVSISCTPWTSVR